MRIRDYDGRTDAGAITACAVELQEFERALDPRMPPGPEIAAAYLADLLDRCRRYDGRILVAEERGEVAGYATILVRMRSDAIDDGDTEFGLVADLVVREAFRNRGIGRALLAASESHARTRGARWLRIGVLAANRAARDLYLSADFAPFAVMLEKPL